MSNAKQTHAKQTHDRVLATAIHILRTEDGTTLTLDAVAKEAGISKGGLLHHFPSKEALLEAVLKQLLEGFAARVAYYTEQEQPRPGRRLRAYIRASFEEDPLSRELILLLLTAILESSTLLQLIQADVEHWQTSLQADGLTAARAAVIRQASDAFWMDRIIERDDQDPALRQAVMDELLQLTEVES